MTTILLFVLGGLALLALLMGFPPAIPIIVLVLALTPLFLMSAARLFRNAPGGARARRQPHTPSTAEASYEPVEDPSARRA